MNAVGLFVAILYPTIRKNSCAHFKALNKQFRVLFIILHRPGFPKVVIVMTDGRQTRDPDAVDLDVAADSIHRQGARVLVVGVGPEISQYELRLIAKDSSYVFTVQSFENLRKATSDVAASACIDPGKFIVKVLDVP